MDSSNVLFKLQDSALIRFFLNWLLRSWGFFWFSGIIFGKKGKTRLLGRLFYHIHWKTSVRFPLPFLLHYPLQRPSYQNMGLASQNASFKCDPLTWSGRQYRHSDCLRPIMTGPFEPQDFMLLWQAHGHGIVRVPPPPHSNRYKKDQGRLHDRK